METGLFDIEADYLIAAGTAPRLRQPARDVVHALFRSDRGGNDATAATRRPTLSATTPQNEEAAADPGHHLAQCFLRLADLPTYPLDRLSRYEHTLWRQVAQILVALDNLNRREPQERRSSLLRGGAGPFRYENERPLDDN
jgi:hypothetical protein